ncbi:sugar nucleotidyltransferase [Tateyamaria sp. Alg231-49]|uniref:sugar nucleotidyltransferase n=1 Tax=Tateyamaria sp. Alg231-49 TaxID=1922219 RepID=UPI000D55C917|nr:sugar phosphate nucleotidyltransferase [Tateyamaria sp. Alg231-49]
MQRKGIILAGGKGTRLRPLTNSVSKPLLPIYDKPMIYYPLTVLMQAGIREIAIITTPEDQQLFQRLLGDGSQWGILLEWIVQPTADGIAQAYLLAEGFLDGAPSALALGDNLFLGDGMSPHLVAANAALSGGTIFTCEVSDPERYGVAAFAGDRVTGIVEKPSKPPSNSAITGLYFLDADAPSRARAVKPSERGEFEIVTLLQSYLEEGALSVQRLGAGIEWFDAGTHDALLEAGQAVQRFQRSGELFGSPDGAAFCHGWSAGATVENALHQLGKTSYGAMLGALVRKDARVPEALRM